MRKMLAFRLDDICPGMKIENLRRIERLFDEHNICPLLGVVPKNEDPHLVVEECNEEEFWDYIRALQDKKWSIAQHGFTHVYSNDNSGILEANPFSEFAGIEYDKQLQMISEGKNLLLSRGLNPTCFMAPGHTFDENTISALVANGIFQLTDGYAKEVYIRDGVSFVPCTLSDPKVPDGIDTLCMHLNGWKEEDFEQLDRFIASHGDICVSFEEISRSSEAVVYGDRIAKQEEKFRKIKERKQKAADSEIMQRYLRKSYSENIYIKLIKRALFLPMLLKK